MAAAVSAPQKKRKETSFPPKRGQIKARIFESFFKTVVSATSKAYEALVRNRGESGDGGGSASATPPASGYNSDGNSDIS